jgi:hypothetical protein
MLERPKYQPFAESVAVVEPPESLPARAREDTTLARPAPDVVPCVVCGSQVRWNDAGVLRCGACWPSPLTQAARRAEEHDQRRRRA